MNRDTWLMLLGAAFLLAGFGAVSLLGWRESTTLLSGTYASPNVVLETMSCGLYLAFYFGAVVLAPILVIAAGFHTILVRALRSRSS